MNDIDTAVDTIEDTRICPRCNGEKHVLHKGFSGTRENGTIYNYPDKWDVCNGCDGAGSFQKPDWNRIMTDITTSRGAEQGKRRIRANMTSTAGFKSKDAARAYYVFRLAAFHGRNKPGDQCMPIMADLVVRSDPYKKELDAFADMIAERFYGTSVRAAARWGRAFGII